MTTGSPEHTAPAEGGGPQVLPGQLLPVRKGPLNTLGQVLSHPVEP
jgi:hypothetical protein